MSLNQKINCANRRAQFCRLDSQRDEKGEPVVIEITANTVEAAKSRLLADGHTELALKENEIMGRGCTRGLTTAGEPGTTGP